MKAARRISTKIEELDLDVSPKLIKQIVNLLGQTWQQSLLKELKTGPVDPYPTYGEVLLDVDNDEACITIEACLSGSVADSLVEDLLDKGFARQDNDGTLTGLGQYAEIELTWAEELVLSALKSAYGRTMTAMGVRRKMKNSWMYTKQVQEALEGLAAKKYVEEVEITEAGSTLYMAL